MPPKPEPLTAIEFFSGIGAFRAVAPEFGIKVIQAFDQNQDANLVYAANYGETVCSRNLDTIPGDEIPDADFWWMSPPCKPFSRRGNRGDLQDPRAAALINLIRMLPSKRPEYFALENVLGFKNSRAEEYLLRVLVNCGYNHKIIEVCPTQFGIPMQRPRLVYVASRGEPIADLAIAPVKKKRPLSEFLIDQSSDQHLELNSQIKERYHQSLNVIKASDPDSQCICFTSGYGDSLKASGSYLKTDDGKVRRFSPEEILALLGFPKSFHFPADMPLDARWRLAGNTVELCSLKAALRAVLADRVVS